MNEEEVELAWRDFEKLTNEKEDDNVVGDCCRYCFGYNLLVDQERGQLVCSDCAACQPDYWSDTVRDNKSQILCSFKASRMSAAYDSLFHFNERLRQLNKTDPFPPACYWKVIKASWISHTRSGLLKHGQRLSKTDVASILQVASEISPTNSCKDPHRIKQLYMERWVSIAWKLTHRGPPNLSTLFMTELTTMFLLVSYNWEKVRHGKGCTNRPIFTSDQDKKEKCKRQFGCRHNLPNFNWMMNQFVNRIIARPKDRSLLQYSILITQNYIPVMKTEARIEVLERYWKLLYQYTRIPLYRNNVRIWPEMGL